MGRHAPSFPLIFGTKQARHCNSDDNAKIAPELCYLKVRMSDFHGRPDDTESITSIGT